MECDQVKRYAEKALLKHLANRPALLLALLNKKIPQLRDSNVFEGIS
jgi:hypothetical protein